MGRCDSWDPSGSGRRGSVPEAPAGTFIDIARFMATFQFYRVSCETKLSDQSICTVRSTGVTETKDRCCRRNRPSPLVYKNVAVVM